MRDKVIRNAEYVTWTEVRDPDVDVMVEICIFKHDNGGMFSVDASFLEQNFEDQDDCIVPDVFNNDCYVKLNGI